MIRNGRQFRDKLDEFVLRESRKTRDWGVEVETLVAVQETLIRKTTHKINALALLLHQKEGREGVRQDTAALRFPEGLAIEIKEGIEQSRGEIEIVEMERGSVIKSLDLVSDTLEDATTRLKKVVDGAQTDSVILSATENHLALNEKVTQLQVEAGRLAAKQVALEKLLEKLLDSRSKLNEKMTAQCVQWMEKQGGEELDSLIQSTAHGEDDSPVNVFARMRGSIIEAQAAVDSGRHEQREANDRFARVIEFADVLRRSRYTRSAARIQSTFDFDGLLMGIAVGQVQISEAISNIDSNYFVEESSDGLTTGGEV